MTATATIRVEHQRAQGFSRAATQYAIRELARRAGATAEFYRTWQVEFHNEGFVSILVEPGTEKRIFFPLARPEVIDGLYAGTFRTSRATWLASTAESHPLIPDFKIPFSSSHQENVGPLFAPTGPQSVLCPVDLPLSVLLTLSRFEETFPVVRDEHGRFCASSSIAWRNAFLHRPIVDEYGFGFAQALNYLLPSWKPQKQSLRVKLGHDVDEIGLPFIFRSAIAHTVRRRKPGFTCRDFLAQVSNADTAYQSLLRELISLGVSRGLDLAVYWKSSGPGPHDTGYDPRIPRIRQMISRFRNSGVEMGIHPSYQSFDAAYKLRTEVGALAELLGTRFLGGRQDFLRWHPRMWLQWESLGLAYDASVGFADHIGFRAGTCHPYRPWLLSHDRAANLIEIPLQAMDSTLLSYMHLGSEQLLDVLFDCVARCRLVGGVFSLVWHNTRIMTSEHYRLYQAILDRLAGSGRYDWTGYEIDIQ